MSIILALLVLFLSLHSCNARVLEVAHNDRAKEFQHSISNLENDEKLNGGGRHVLVENSVGDAERGKSRSVNVVVRDSSVSKKSWKVPHKKRGEEEAGFNLDYLPPKTHPPSHN